MKVEDLQKKYDRLFDKVRQMRVVQKDYFRYRASVDLKRSKRLEREVDQMITEEIKSRESNQKEMF